MKGKAQHNTIHKTTGRDKLRDVWTAALNSVILRYTHVYTLRAESTAVSSLHNQTALVHLDTKELRTIDRRCSVAYSIRLMRNLF
jgi:hypothetical protein